ncbi:hypothetical protein O181_033674 [Austropuccinia psidii MF-1]|uniref:Uncharacterized protein n=1 Tax=Austropuccinia psidii MF-1 TaxID=1389203 RepID=A0A9Q3H8S7_9BASI|nr:hypothetical protein [Austropuccinia psidii MF-1]
MTPTRSGSHYSIQSNGSGPGHSSHEHKRQEFHPRGGAKMEDTRASTSSRRKTAGVGTSSKPLDRDNKLLPSRKKGLGPREYREPSEGLNTHVLQRKSSKYKFLIDKQNCFVRGPEEIVGPKEGQQPGGSSSRIHKNSFASTSSKQQSEGQEKGKGKGKAQVEQTLPSYLQSSKEVKDSHGKCVQCGKNFYGIQKKG